MLSNSLKRMAEFSNPKSFFGRFPCQFALFYSALLVVQLVAYLLGRWDVFYATIGSLAFSVLISLIRAGMIKPGQRFWRSPFASAPHNQR